MGGTQTLSREPASDPTEGTRACPRCDSPWPAASAVVTTLFGGRALGRCLRCGVRFTAGSQAPRRVRTCDQCSLPFLGDDAPPGAAARCDDCAAGRTPADLVDASVVSATEAEVRLALDAQWRFVTSRPLAAYLGAIMRRVAERLDGATPSSRIVLIDEAALHSLTLPSGLVLISTGLLASLEDEAELVFVLGHELAHATLGDAAARLVRLGLHTVSRDQASGERAHEIWGRAVADLILLGYGKRREREADRLARSAMVDLGYDPGSALSFLDRLQVRCEERDPRCREYAFAHPSPRQRRRWIQAGEGAAVPSSCAYRVNRELFRRVAGHSALTRTLVPLASLSEEPELLPRREARDPVSLGFFWAGLGVLLLVAVIAMVALALSG